MKNSTTVLGLMVDPSSTVELNPWRGSDDHSNDNLFKDLISSIRPNTMSFFV